MQLSRGKLRARPGQINHRCVSRVIAGGGKGGGGVGGEDESIRREGKERERIEGAFALRRGGA